MFKYGRMQKKIPHWLVCGSCGTCLVNIIITTVSFHDFQIYVKQRNLVKSQIRSVQRNYEERLINKFSINPKAF